MVSEVRQMDITTRLHNLMLRPGFQAREDQETLLAGKQEIERLRSALNVIAEHCANAGRGNAIINDRTIDRVEEVAMEALGVGQ
jgi:hypothetical protein